ncbi:rRNA methyltransferase 1, mitochondrial [Candida viswanathii]|uniref:rRNA methyltransferase 1, mitochondrial n=1 Tax=Candida viswanathii TaxID=5486 RepID=A0A367XMU9_9ASCO|nr:rRNA methyltransferase 1, mitochondrial [Candida viswanathii]
MLSQKRSFSVLPALLKSRDLKPVFKPHHPNPKNTPKSFTKSLPQSKKEAKPWEKKNLSKDEFFMRKYGNIKPEQRKALDEKVARQRKYRDMKMQHEKERRVREREERERARDLARALRAPSRRDSDSSEGGLFGRTTTIFDYIFGTHAVKAALTAGKRRVLELYTYNNSDREIVRLAEEKYGLEPREVKDKHALNLLCKNGVHNGVVLKTRKLDVNYIQELGHAEEGSYQLAIENDEDGSVEKMTKPVIREAKEGEAKPFPLVLFIDGVTDPQNMGNILRSAFFFGVDAVIVPEDNSAKLGPVAFKASAGALDLIDLYTTDSSLKFITLVRNNGWFVISTSGRPDESSSDKEQRFADKFIELEGLQTVLRKAPVMLVIGSEGEGVRTNIKIASDYLVAIDKYRSGDAIVDSLNVGVATGVILQSCVGK